MQSKAATPEEYIKTLPEERRKTISELRKVIKKNLPKGFKEVMSYGMIGYVVPHTIYPKGYHCNPELPLPFMCLASQKNFISLYHMGLYGNAELMKWFKSEFSKQSKLKPDMGKSCIRFKKTEGIPYKLIGELSSKITAKEWITIYEKLLKK